MKRLILSLFGQFRAILHDKIVTDFQTNKARALLAYLAVESGRPHERAKLAEMFWPGFTEESARVNLRRALSTIRKMLEDDDENRPLLLVNTATLQFNPQSDYWLDVIQFVQLTSRQTQANNDNASQGSITDREEAVKLYRGTLLESVSLDDCPGFEEWLLPLRQHFQDRMLDVLAYLANHSIKVGKFESAYEYIRLQLDLDRNCEEAYRQRMQLLMHEGKRSAALAQFELCRLALAADLGVEPSTETLALYQRIRDQPDEFMAESTKFPVTITPRIMTSPFFSTIHTHIDLPPVIVARQQELARLAQALTLAQSGQGRIVFITGDAGQGKTALATEFARYAQETVNDLVVAMGNCNAHTGVGDPYLPFCEILSLLTGDIEAKWTAGALGRLHATRLWAFAPVALQTVVELGPDLVDTFVTSTPLLTRAAAFATTDSEWLMHLDNLVKRKQSSEETLKPRQEQLFGQVVGVLQSLARQRPLLLLLDDLQWADSGSINLLFHLARELAGSRILLIGLYRATEVNLGRNGGRHPLEQVINECKRTFGEIELDLGRAEGRTFVDAFLNTEPNRLSEGFRQTLYQQTGGHPLFTVELLRGMQERGDLMQNNEGYWIEGATLDWETLPARVDAVIGERIGRLPEHLQQLLRIASVEGELFTAEIIARIMTIDEQEVIYRLSSELERRHRLVRAQGIQRLEHQRLSHYRFGHILFQRYLYTRLDLVERVYWHEAIGYTLESLYRDHADTLAEVASQLARHFEEADLVQKAVAYLHIAGTRALRLAAHAEAITHLTQALALLARLPETQERKRLELDLRLLLGPSIITIRGYSAPQVLEVYAAAHKLCKEISVLAQYPQIVWGLFAYYNTRNQQWRAIKFAEEFMALAESTQDTGLLVEAHRSLGPVLFNLGEFQRSRFHLEQTIALYDTDQHKTNVYLYAHDPGVTAHGFLGFTLWALGYPDQALQRVEEGIALGQRIGHLFSLAYVQNAAVIVCQYRGNLTSLWDYSEDLLMMVTKQGFQWFKAQSTICRGWTVAQQGQLAIGLEELQAGLAAAKTIGANWGIGYFFSLLADTYRIVGQTDAGLNVIHEALYGEARGDERHWDAELYRLKGELLLLKPQQRPDAIQDAETCFHQALHIARQQDAKSLELRTAMSLARLWLSQDKKAEARQLLAPLYGWFTEGFDTQDLKEAKALLETLL
ncbi:hypothetical protein BH10CHL1_BH10CHL1_31800 [soil metagenome]